MAAYLPKTKLSGKVIPLWGDLQRLQIPSLRPQLGRSTTVYISPDCLCLPHFYGLPQAPLFLEATCSSTSLSLLSQNVFLHLMSILNLSWCSIIPITTRLKAAETGQIFPFLTAVLHVAPHGNPSLVLIKITSSVYAMARRQDWMWGSVSKDGRQRKREELTTCLNQGNGNLPLWIAQLLAYWDK